jgi:hypothetical protein
LGNVLPKVLARQPGSGRLAELRVQVAFVELIGTDLAAQCEGLGLRSGVLTVSTGNPALAHQLRLDSEQLMVRLNGMQLGRRLRSIRVRTGRGQGSTPS